MITPAMLNPAVTPATIHQTICVKGYASAYRAKTLTRSRAYSIKMKMLRAKGIFSGRGWILDHRISIESGGSSDVSNLQLQNTAEAHRKDLVENAVNKEICTGKITLQTGQSILYGWHP